MAYLDTIWRRKKVRDTVSGGNEGFDQSYNRATGAFKQILTHGKLEPIGDCVARKELPFTGAIVSFYNPSATADAFIAFGDVTVAAPVGGATGVAIPPKSYLTICAGLSTHVIASASCFAYVLDDDSYLAKQNG